MFVICISFLIPDIKYLIDCLNHNLSFQLINVVMSVQTVATIHELSIKSFV